MTFDDFNFHPAIADALYYMHFDEPTPVQQKAIPAIMQGRDVMATAQTGTGKTASFVLPVLNRLTETPSDHTDTLIIVPTRELAVQIDRRYRGFHIIQTPHPLLFTAAAAKTSTSSVRLSKTVSTSLWQRRAN